MKKSDLIAYVAQREEIPLQVAHDVVEIIFNSMKDSLLEGGRVELRGFGSLRVKHYDAYVGRNPKTGEAVPVPEKRLVLFKMGKELIELLNDGHPQQKKD